jgi:hypothetical protein
MVDQPDRSIIIRLSPEQLEQADFLQGLESWLQLGLLSDRQVRQVCQQYLTCSLADSTIPVSFSEPAQSPTPSEPIAILPMLHLPDRLRLLPASADRCKPSCPKSA